jgi:hypothetical protein
VLQLLPNGKARVNNVFRLLFQNQKQEQVLSLSRPKMELKLDPILAIGWAVKS